jgi:hypothetical protein
MITMTKKEAIRAAEEQIEDALNDLEWESKVRAYSVRIISGRGEDFEVLITEDAKGGSR